jgi:hypothetical protein
MSDDENVGRSSQAMAFKACDIEFVIDAPRDAGDFNRCLKLLAAVPEIKAHIQKIATLSDEWSEVIENWDSIEATFIEEAGVDWIKGRSAPKTNEMIRKIVS